MNAKGFPFLAFREMDPNVFRKGDASSVLVVDKSWKDIIDKPDFLDELSKRILLMSHAAEAFGQVTKATTFQQFKNAVNSVLMDPLIETVDTDEQNVVRKHGSVLVDAYWDEIIKTDDDWKELKSAVERAYIMKVKIGEHNPLTSSDTLMKSKETFNDTVMKPLLGINEDE